MKTTDMKKKLYACVLTILLGASLFTGCQTSQKHPVATDLLPEERDSITIDSLSPDHIYYNEVISLDPSCKNYIQELSIYDTEIDDTFIVHISLPPNYDETRSYPMLVMTDGVWRLSDHVELRPLMISGTIEDIIMVSIGYPNDYDYQTIRERDLVDAPDAYLHFIVDNLVPYLEEIYSVDTENITLTGHSLGGYWAYYALFHSDTIGKNTFRNYYIGSPSMWASTNGTMMTAYEEEYYTRNQTLNANVYITVGSEEDSTFQYAAYQFYKHLTERNYSGLTLTYEEIEGYDHNTVFKPSIKNALLMFYGTSTK
ncbi:MAG: alpha/beta hydrolase-fold protein [Clostridium sp.]|nr:alpha/beta hydrolase-fold protein [Clostridium sp.]